MATLMTRVQKVLEKEFSPKEILLEPARRDMVDGWIISKSFDGLSDLERGRIEMRIEATDYVEAAKERLTEANLLYEKARYALALYVAAVAVESLLRAHLVQLDPNFDEAHNLKMLLEASKLRIHTTLAEHQQINAAVDDLFKRWRNDLRYTSNNHLRRRFKRKKLDRGIRGDFLKENSCIAIEAAEIILKIGVAKWKQS